MERVRSCDPRKSHDEALHREQYFFHREDPLFQDHFPGRPVIPGSLLVSCFHKTASRWLTGAASASTWILHAVSNARFIAFGEPGCVEVRMDGFSPHDDGLLLDFSAVQNGKLLALARLRYEPS